MSYLKEKIAEKLDSLNERELQEVFNFVSVMRSENIAPTQPSSQETEEECQLKYVGGVLVVAASGAENWENAVKDLREERIGKFIW